jgi:IS30 family transposase
LKLWYSIPRCAKELGRHKSTLYECLQTNHIPYNRDCYRYVWGKSGDISYSRLVWKRVVRFNSEYLAKSRAKRKSAASIRHTRIQKASSLTLFIERKIRKRWSPEQISGRWRFETHEKLSKDTIYRYIYSNHREWIRKYFRRKGRKYISHAKRQALKLLDRRSIELRPEEIESRETFGHFEGDTVVGIQGTTACFLTLVERKTGWLIARTLPNRKSESVLQAFVKRLSKRKQRLMKTLTLDNWVEFALHSLIEYETKTPIYFAHIYCSCERATNENTNGLLRQYFPKKTNLSGVTEKELQRVVTEINWRPRKRLWYRTPSEAMREELGKKKSRESD